MPETLPVQYGVRVRCCADGCTRSFMKWPDDGDDRPGSPPVDWLVADCNASGWFVSREGFADPNKKHTPLFRAYCPDHARPALDWLHAREKWKQDKEDERKRLMALVWKQQSPLQKLRNWSEDLHGKTVGQLFMLWNVAHPEPKPPWKK